MLVLGSRKPEGGGGEDVGYLTLWGILFSNSPPREDNFGQNRSNIYSKRLLNFFRKFYSYLQYVRFPFYRIFRFLF